MSLPLNELAFLAKESYLEASEQIHALHKFREDGADAFVYPLPNSTKNTVVVAFRGTSETSDMIADLDVRHHHIGKGAVHNGFFNYTMPLIPHIDEVVAQYDYMYVTGHSLGGAMALVYCLMTQHPDKIQGLVTFGQPKTLTSMAFAQMQERSRFPYVRVVNNMDLVPNIPMLQGFCHPNRCILVHDNGKVEVPHSPWATFRVWCSHSMRMLCRRSVVDALLDDHSAVEYKQSVTHITDKDVRQACQNIRTFCWADTVHWFKDTIKGYIQQQN